MITVNWIAGLPTTAVGFEMIQNHVDLLSGKVHSVPTRSTATATDAAAIIRDMRHRSGDGFPDGPRLQVHERGAPGLRQGLGLVSHHQLGIS